MEPVTLSAEKRLSDRAFILLAAVAFAALICVFEAAAYLFLQRVYMLGDIQIFYRMVDVIVSGGTPYVDYTDSKPPLIFYALTIPALLGEKIVWGLALTGACNLASALLVTSIGWRLYGRGAGFFAGLFFLVNLVWAEGYFILIEPFALVFVLGAVYCLLAGGRYRYLAAGFLAGLAAGFKQYTLLLLPLALLFMWRKGELKMALPFLAGAGLALAAVFGSVFAAYGVDAGFSSLQYTFAVAGTYLPQSYTGEVAGYALGGPAMLLVNLALGSSLFVLVLLLALAAYAAGRRTAHEEFFLLCGLAFAATVVIRPFFHYWALALPFIALVCASRFGSSSSRSESGFGSGAGWASKIVPLGLYALVVGAFSVASLLVARGFMAGFGSFYAWAELFIRGLSPYLDVSGGLLAGVAYFSMPAELNIALTGLVALACTLLVARIGADLYGRAAGFVAGLLFVASISWAIGFLLPGDLVALGLVLLSTRLVLRKNRLFLAGLLVGAAVAFKPLAVLAAAAALLMLWRDRRTGDAKAYAAGLVLPIALAIGAVLALPQIIQEGGRTSNAYLQSANIVASVTVLSSLLVFGLAGFRLGRPGGRAEELFIAASLLFVGTLLVREYLYYWAFALPFIALLCARQFARWGDQKA